MQGHKNEGKHILCSKGSYRAGMEENIPTVTEVAGWGSVTAALRVQCRGKSLITTLLSSPKADFLTEFSEMHSIVHAAKSHQRVHEPQFINRSFT